MAERDLLVVGGGPAGLFCAIAARRHGLTVSVLEARQPPLDKACGEGLMPDGLELLEAQGVALPEQRPFHGIRYLSSNQGQSLRVEGRFPPGHAGAGVRRLHLHQALLERAAEVGVDLRFGERVSGLTADGVRTEGGELDARFLVGADGLHSKVRAWAGLEGRRALWQRFGVRRHFAIAPWCDLVEVYWGPKAEAYVTPVGENEVGIAILWSGRKANFDALLADFPALAARVQGVAVLSKDRGAGPLEQRVRHVSRGRVHLVGDAAGYLDAITGEGLSLAFHQAQLLADCLAKGQPELYAARAAAICASPLRLTRLTLLLEKHPWLRRRVMRAFAAEPALFERFLAVHCRAESPSQLFAPRFLARFLRRFLRPGEVLPATPI